MLMCAPSSFPARKLFTSSMDKESLSKRLEEEVYEAMKSSTERLQEKYNIDFQYLMSNKPTTMASISNPSIKLQTTLENPSKFLSTSKIHDTWRWESIDTKNQYIPSFYLSRKYHSDTYISTGKYDGYILPKTPAKQIKKPEIIRSGNKVEFRHSFPVKNESARESEMRNFTKHKCTQSRINTWNIPVKKWSQNMNTKFDKPALNRSSSLSQLDRIISNKCVVSDNNTLKKTASSAGDLSVHRCAASIPDMLSRARKTKSKNIGRNVFPVVKYRQLTMLEILSDWHEHTKNSYLCQKTVP
uniref:Uncharacterized protein n=1 Tax=Trichobilharzia regenti TaxID=157069 RepID=A0AA85JF45_TRIRE|nr:unnamed protein product [Trichobilharzia regenti]